MPEQEQYVVLLYVFPFDILHLLEGERPGDDEMIDEMADAYIGSALAGAAGVLVGLVFGQINHFMGFNYGLKGFTAAVVGGIGSIPGAMLGGLFIGLAEAFAAGLRRSTLFGPDRLLDPDRGDDLPPERPARQGRR